MDFSKNRWLYIVGDVDILLDDGFGIHWYDIGFSIKGIRWACSNGYQSVVDGVLHTLYPIENDEKFNKFVGYKITENTPEWQVISYDDANSIKENIKNSPSVAILDKNDQYIDPVISTLSSILETLKKIAEKLGA